MTIEEAKKLLPSGLKYPLLDEDIDNLLELQKLTIDGSDSEDSKMNYLMMAALIELKERRNGGSKNSDAREDFMFIVYNELSDDVDNNRANRIIDAADVYADSF